MNKKTLLVTIFSILLPAISYAGNFNGWIYQNPYPTSNTLLAVKFITPEKGWIAGEKGTILYTQDGGDTWEAQESGTEADIKSLAFVNEKTGWAVGNGGTIIHTEDAGKTWFAQGDIKSTLNKVYFVNEKEGWAVGSEGTVLHTSDGGKHWEKQDVGIKRSIASLYFLNAQTGWILAGDEVYRTKDEGKTWEKSLLTAETPKAGTAGGSYIISGMEKGIPEDWWQGDIFFVNDNQGWAVEGLWNIFKTKDGGKTWEAKDFGYMSYGLGNIFFTDEKKGCAAGSTIICTEDGGKSWKERLGVAPGAREEIGGLTVSIWGLNSPDRSIGWAVGNNGQIFKTEDSGKNWKLTTITKENTLRWNFVNDKTAFAFEDNSNSIVRTDDGGKTSRVLKKFEEPTSWANLYFINSKTGWIAVSQWKGKKFEGPFNTLILHTRDGGKTWISQFNQPSGAIDELFFVSSEVGWAIGKGKGGLILHTEDGGKHWRRQKSGTKLKLQNAFFVDSKKGWITMNTESSGEKAIILQTEDGGDHWKTQLTKEGVWLFGGIFFMNDKGWITGVIGDPDNGSGILLSTTDGGKTWSETIFNMIVYPPQFVDKDRGVILSYKGIMFITTDGGKTWDKRREPIRRYPWHISEIFKSADSK